jgi:hypothetical protein
VFDLHATLAARGALDGDAPPAYLPPAWPPTPDRIPYSFPPAPADCLAFLGRGVCNRAGCRLRHTRTKLVRYCWLHREGACAGGCGYPHLDEAAFAAQLAAALAARKRGTADRGESDGEGGADGEGGDAARGDAKRPRRAHATRRNPPRASRAHADK